MTLIELQGINKTYNNGQPLHVLKGIDLSIDRGEFVSIMGASGSGKSTLLNILGILDNYDTGTYMLNGKLIKNLSETQAADYRNRMIGFIFQSFNLISFKTAVENVELPLYYQGVPRKKRHEMAMDYLERLGLGQWANHFPNQMSGGQKQRVAIAGIIAMRPDCIVLDEPTAMLDPQGRKEVMRTIQLLNRDYGITIILITHEMDEAAQCDRVIVVDHGEVVMDDRPEAVFSQVQRMRELGLDVPQATELCDLLRQSGYDLPPDILHADQCIDAIAELFTQKGFVTNAGTGSD